MINQILLFKLYKIKLDRYFVNLHLKRKMKTSFTIISLLIILIRIKFGKNELFEMLLT